jgi:integrase/recombinase XerD
MERSFEGFIRERRYLKNVSPRTIQWYEESFNWLKKYPLTEDGVKEFVMGMREAGLKATSCNSRIRVANAFFRWAGMPLHIARLPEPAEVLPVFGKQMVEQLVAFKPRDWYGRRLKAIVCVLLDCGLRVDECLSLRRVDVDMENMLLKVVGKGDKERLIPFSHELRKLLYQWSAEHEFQLVFPTRHGTHLGRRDVLRDLKNLCRRLGFEPPRRTIHALRHSFSANWIKRGGDVYLLSRMLGHSRVTTTELYLKTVGSEQARTTQERVSLLGRR